MYAASPCGPLKFQGLAGAGARRLIPGVVLYTLPLNLVAASQRGADLAVSAVALLLIGLWVDNLNGVIAKILDDGYVVNWVRNINGTCYVDIYYVSHIGRKFSHDL
uniref:Uncharacterized protein n=1 Tax=mine drainage metagenome TaxID=410659 RepID=E6QC25_9ZZZZ